MFWSQYPKWYFNPDGAGGGAAAPSADVSGSNGAAAAPAAPAPSAPAAASSPAAAAPSVPSAPSAPASPAQAAEWQGVREALKPFGLDYSYLPDDAAALQHMAMQLRQLQAWRQQHEPVVSSPEVQALLRQRGQQAPAAPAEKWWKAPEFNPEWQHAIYTDPDGKLRVRDGHDPMIAQKYMDFVRHRNEVMTKLATDPVALLQDGFRPVIQQIAQEMFQRQWQEQQERAATQQVLSGNANWLYAKDAQGQVVFDPMTRQPALSAEGQVYAQYVAQAQARGIYDTAGQHEYALGMTQRDAAIAQLKQMTAAQQAAAAGEAAKTAFVQNGNHPNASGSGAGTSAASHPNGTPLLQRLRKNMQAAGINPHDSLPVGNG